MSIVNDNQRRSRIVHAVIHPRILVSIAEHSNMTVTGAKDILLGASELTSQL